MTNATEGAAGLAEPAKEPIAATHESPHEAPPVATQPPEPAAPDAPPPAPRGGLREWLWRGSALRQAVAEEQTLPERRRRRLDHARTACEMADRALDPVDPLLAGTSTHLAVSLYREAAYFALLAQSDEQIDGDLAEVFDGADPALLAYAAGGRDGVVAVREALVERSFVETSSEHLDDQRRDAGLAKDFVHALVRRAMAPRLRVGQLLLQRYVRLGVVGVSSLVLLLGGGFGLRTVLEKPDLAAGRPWRTSPASLKCAPEEHSCGGARTDILFHTNDEESPWYEIDLGSAMAFSRVDVTNRSDCCPDRAIPLAIEVSDDRVKWTEVARRTEPFSVWKATFAPQRARYVRTRALRKTILHLERVAVRAS